jgi:hypothetical protein
MMWAPPTRHPGSARMIRAKLGRHGGKAAMMVALQPRHGRAMILDIIRTKPG